MTGRPAAALATAALLLLATGSGCSKARLQEIPGLDPPEIDNLMAVTGQYCTQPPEETVFPVKILFVLD